MEQILEGNLSRFEVPDLLNLLSMGRRTGVLVLERPSQETKVFLRDGRPVYATSTSDELRLGNLLVRLGKLNAEAVRDALVRRGGSGYRLGQLLLADRLLSEDELASVLKVQVSQVIFETLDWRAGGFTFFDRVSPPAAAVTLEMDLQNLIMEGVRRIDARNRLGEVFSDLSMVVESVVNPERVKQSVTLTREEWQVYFLIDGRRSLGEICRLVGNSDELATLQILYHLVSARFVAVSPAPLGATPALPMVAVAAEAPGTQHLPEPQPPAGPIEIEFSAGLISRKVQDDTGEIVSPNAVQYLGSAKAITLSRVVLYKDGTETSFPLTRDTYTMGRHRNNDIVINDPKVSSFHARIDRTQDGFCLVDLKSRNGSYLNGKRIESALLRTADEIRLGTARLIYRVDYRTSDS